MSYVYSDVSRERDWEEPHWEEPRTVRRYYIPTRDESPTREVVYRHYDSPPGDRQLVIRHSRSADSWDRESEPPIVRHHHHEYYDPVRFDRDSYEGDYGCKLNPNFIIHYLYRHSFPGTKKKKKKPFIKIYISIN